MRFFIFLKGILFSAMEAFAENVYLIFLQIMEEGSNKLEEDLCKLRGLGRFHLGERRNNIMRKLEASKNRQDKIRQRIAWLKSIRQARKTRQFIY